MNPILAELDAKIMMVIGVVLAVAGLVFFILLANFLSVWVRALFSGARVKFTELIGLRLRSVLVGRHTDEPIMARLGAGTVTPLDASRAYEDVLEHPDGISKSVLPKALD